MSRLRPAVVTHWFLEGFSIDGLVDKYGCSRFDIEDAIRKRMNQLKAKKAKS